MRLIRCLSTPIDCQWTKYIGFCLFDLSLDASMVVWWGEINFGDNSSRYVTLSGDIVCNDRSDSAEGDADVHSAVCVFSGQQRC